MRRCSGVTKAGTPCRYILGENEELCPHHDPDQSRKERLLKRAAVGQEAREIPDEIEITELSTSKDIQFGFQQVIKAASTKKKVDLKRLDVVIRALNGANAVQQTEEIREQNRILMMLDGHGASLAAIQRLKDAPTRQLPGRKLKQIGPKKEAGDGAHLDDVDARPDFTAHRDQRRGELATVSPGRPLGGEPAVPEQKESA